MNQLKDFAKGRAIAVGKKIERDIIDAAKGIDKGVIAAKQLKESAFPKHQLATPDRAIVSGSKEKTLMLPRIYSEQRLKM
ncbi:hypothetical protein [Pseudogracilibacillus sp. SO30301A]|uniref:hypothetical protein n=1 Tax=Pseudogracilibacillus sp. SO30301A TaxID=3098291 RepID=UPI00300E6124